VRTTRPRAGALRTSHTALFPHIDLEHGTRLTELARRVGISKQAVAQLVDELESFGMLERRPDPEDGRAKRIAFSTSGRGALVDGLEALAEVEAELRARVGSKAMASLKESVEKLLEALEPPPGVT